MKAMWGALMIAAFATAAWAQTDEEMKKLKEAAAKEQDEEMKNLPKRVSDLEKKVAQQKLEDKSTFRAYWKDGFNLETADKSFTFNCSGRIHIDAGVAFFDEDYQTRFARDHDTEDQLFFRRARMQMGGTILTHVVYKIEIDFAGAAVAFTDTFIGLKSLPLAEHFTPDFTVGHFKEPFSIEELTSSRFITFIERSLLNGAFTPARNSGFMINDSVLTDRITWAFGMFKDVGGSGNTVATVQDGRWAFTTRFTGLPWYEKDGKELIHLGVAGRFSNPGIATTFAVRPESRVQTTSPTGTTPAFAIKDVDQVIQWAFDLAAVWGPFWAQAEYMINTIDHQLLSDTTFTGWYASMGFFLTGESRVYSKTSGAFSRQKVDKPLFGGGENAGWGAWEIAARFSWVDLSDNGINGDEHSGLTIALNWYLNPNTRLMIDYVAYEVNGPNNTAATRTAHVDIISIRFSVDW